MDLSIVWLIFFYWSRIGLLRLILDSLPDTCNDLFLIGDLKVIAERTEVIVAIEVASKEEWVLEQALPMADPAEDFSLKRILSFLLQGMTETT